MTLEEILKPLPEARPSLEDFRRLDGVVEHDANVGARTLESRRPR